MHLDVSELFITLVFQNFAKKSNIMIFFKIGFDSVNYSCDPFNDERFQTISLIKECVHELFHCLSRKFTLFTFQIIFDFLVINFINQIFQLLKSQSSCLCWTNWLIPLCSCLWLSENSLSWTCFKCLIFWFW